MKILVACEESQVVCIAFRKLGHEAYSCDILPCSGGHPEWHIQGDVRDVLNQQWDMIIAFPDCTYLTVTANKWLKDQPKRKSGALVGSERVVARKMAIDFFMLFANHPCKKKVIENPVGCMSSVWRKPNQIVTPTQFGHKEPKKTCLWIEGLPNLTPTKLVEPEYTTTKSGKRMATWYYYAKKTRDPKTRAKLRSKTFPGIANAMALQWGGEIPEPPSNSKGATL